MRTFRLIIIFCLYLLIASTELFSQAHEESLEWLEWKHQTYGLIYASPVISDGTLYIGSTDSIFYSIEPGSGKVKWLYHSGNSIHTSAAVHKNLIFFESGNYLIALNKRGKLKWKKKLFQKNQWMLWICLE